ncbi:MAG TPA: orotidine-5'-phosphate decarboxylase [Spirochaetota bacterium]|nr:orotidine-5'-phosphate decarboxylase [Spirochaetota bacterium]HPI88362.1 orotidine-5'-phosphate decarboxylase [Spirochaetota bacterium]HPR46780.1 orotidine-5'-phosphate decarboxylase [Spirochaetota bacterium]
MNYIETLKTAAKKFNSIVCMGLDPVIEDIPLQGKPGGIIEKFYLDILNEIIQKKIYPGAVKPNYAFYAQYGLQGIEALMSIISIYSREGIPVILDVKRGDIGKTAEAYAIEAFDFFKADAVTLSPYMGYDSISPFMKRKPDGGFYILTKTSNKSSGDIQDIVAGEKPLFMHTAEKIIQWYSPGIGSVVGATYPEQLAEVSSLFNNSGKEIPLLIPGVGSQGGDLQSVVDELKKSPDIMIHRINSSSALNYAYKKNTDVNYAAAAVQALHDLNNQINRLSGA